MADRFSFSACRVQDWKPIFRLIGTFPRTPKPDAGLLPDVAVSLTAEDIAQGGDPAMRKAVDIIQRG